MGDSRQQGVAQYAACTVRFDWRVPGRIYDSSVGCQADSRIGEGQRTMLTPLETQIAEQFRIGLASKEGLSESLVDGLHGLLVGEATPTAVSVFDMITSAAGDQTV